MLTVKVVSQSLKGDVFIKVSKIHGEHRRKELERNV